MAKDPAFLFYTNDFERGVQFFSDEQVGKYIRLLMAQHQHGHLSEKQMIHICKSYDNDVFSKFEKDSAGLYYNERLELEIDKRKNFSLSRSKNKAGKTHISKSYDNHMENENENIIEVKKSKKAEPKKFNSLDHIPERWNGDLFLVEWDDFMIMRRRKKFDCSDKTLTRRIKQLRELSGDDWTKALAMLQKSTEKGYAEFFAPHHTAQAIQTEGRYAHERVTIRDKA